MYKAETITVHGPQDLPAWVDLSQVRVLSDLLPILKETPAFHSDEDLPEEHTFSPAAVEDFLQDVLCDMRQEGNWEIPPDTDAEIVGWQVDLHFSDEQVVTIGRPSYDALQMEITRILTEREAGTERLNEPGFLRIGERLIHLDGIAEIQSNAYGCTVVLDRKAIYSEGMPEEHVGPEVIGTPWSFEDLLCCLDRRGLVLDPSSESAED